jgi:hypothetical protein
MDAGTISVYLFFRMHCVNLFISYWLHHRDKEKIKQQRAFENDRSSIEFLILIQQQNRLRDVVIHLNSIKNIFRIKTDI